MGRGTAWEDPAPPFRDVVVHLHHHPCCRQLAHFHLRHHVADRDDDPHLSVPLWRDAAGTSRPKVAQTMHRERRLGPDSAQACPMWTRCGPESATFVHVPSLQSKFAPTWPNSARIGRTSSRSGLLLQGLGHPWAVTGRVLDKPRNAPGSPAGVRDGRQLRGNMSLSAIMGRFLHCKSSCHSRGIIWASKLSTRFIPDRTYFRPTGATVNDGRIAHVAIRPCCDPPVFDSGRRVRIGVWRIAARRGRGEAVPRQGLRVVLSRPEGLPARSTRSWQSGLVA